VVAHSNLQTIRAGLFSLVAIIIFAGMALWVAGSEWIRGSSSSYTVIIPHSGTLAVGDPVVIAGVPVGRVADMDLDISSSVPVSVRVEIDPALTLRSDSTARIVLLDLLGGTALEIEPGSPAAERLKPGDNIRGTASANAQAMLTRADELAKRTLRLMRQAGTILSALSQEMPTTVNSMGRFSESAASAANRLDKLASQFERNLPGLLKHTDQASARVVNLLNRAEGIIDHLDSLSTKLNQALGGEGERITTLLDEAQAAFREAHEATSVISDNRLVIERTLESLSRTAASLERFSDQIKERPYSLIRVLPMEDRTPGEPMGINP
jgi:ABC-type transporter Mla subunit MlaD